MKDRPESGKLSRYDPFRLFISGGKPEYEDFPSFMREMIRKYRNDFCDGEVSRFTRGDIADARVV